MTWFLTTLLTGEWIVGRMEIDQLRGKERGWWLGLGSWWDMEEFRVRLDMPDEKKEMSVIPMLMESAGGEWWCHVLREECSERNTHKGWESRVPLWPCWVWDTLEISKERCNIGSWSSWRGKGENYPWTHRWQWKPWSCRATYRQSGGREKKRAKGRALGLSSVNQLGRGVNADKWYRDSKGGGNIEEYDVSGLPWWLSGKESACQCRRLRFHPGFGKIPCRRKWQPTPVFLPVKSHGQRSLVGYSPWGSQKSQTQLSN